MSVPDELAVTLRRTPEELHYDLRLRALAGLVERGLLSSGRAAELAGVSRRSNLEFRRMAQPERTEGPAGREGPRPAPSG